MYQYLLNQVRFLQEIISQGKFPLTEEFKSQILNLIRFSRERKNFLVSNSIFKYLKASFVSWGFDSKRLGSQKSKLKVAYDSQRKADSMGKSIKITPRGNHK